jgi:hypothetical protein|tara:strand:+ start:112 stop:402 length:291 start_codon:yes stop_codon:yes gene_type:complete
MTDVLTTMDRVRVYAAVSPEVTIDNKTATVLCTLADVGVRAHRLAEREAELKKGLDTLRIGRERLKHDTEYLEGVRRTAMAAFAIGILSALFSVFV